MDRAWLSSWDRNGFSSSSGGPILLFSGEDQVHRLVGAGGTWSGRSFLQVVPLEKEIGQAHFENWLSTFPAAVRKEGWFSLDNGFIRGGKKLEHVTVCALNRTDLWPKRPTLVIDVGFFLPLYKDEVRTPMINLAMRLISTLKAAGVESDSIWLVRRNGDFEFPLEFGYLPGLLQETFTNPERFSNSLPEKWKRLDAAQYLAFFGQVEEALREYEDLMRLEDAPFLLYEGAILKFKYGDLDAGIKYLRGAAIKDRDYSRGFLLQALYFWRKGELAATESILRAGRDLFPDDEMMSIGLARVLTEQALSEREADPLGAKSRVDEALSLAIPEEIRKEITHVWGRGVPPGEK